MLKKPRRENKKFFEKNADRMLQELGRKTYDHCLICGGEYSCLHHFVYKSQSTALRYDWDNCIPVCARCHSSIHVGQNDMVVGRIVAIKGTEWFEDLATKKREGIGQNFGSLWFREKFEHLKGVLA